MTIPMTQLLKDAAARAGFHVVRNYQNPSHTLMGLRRLGFSTVLDVGANSGQFARWVRTQLPDAEIYCFEPTPRAFEDLRTWASTTTGVHAFQLALGESAGELEMNVHDDHTTSSSLLATSATCEELYPFTASQSRLNVRISRLDDHLASLPRLPRPEWLLKIDVQGFEMPVLLGAPLTLEQVRASIVEVSLDNLYVGQSGFAEIVALMARAGLSYAGNFQQIYGADGHVISIDALFLREGPATRGAQTTSSEP